MTERLFFALWPDDRTRARIARRLPEWTARLDGRLQRPDQWHMTLEFIGAADASLRAELQEAASLLAFPACELQFDQFEHWRKPHVACLVASVTPAPLARFVAQLRAAVVAAGVASDPRPWQPHVTIARKVRSAGSMPVDPPLCWPASGFVLVRSISDPTGSRYEPVHWWNGGHRGS